MKSLIIGVVSFGFLVACSSSKVTVQQKIVTVNKRIAIGNIDIQSLQKSTARRDTLCACIPKQIKQLFIPYLQQAGFIVIDLPADKNESQSRFIEKADSLHLDYILSGTGLVNTVGSSVFVEQMTVKIADLKTGEIAVSSSFSGVSTRPKKAVDNIGKKMLAQLN